MESSGKPAQILISLFLLLVVLGGIGWNIYLGKMVSKIQSVLEAQRWDIQMMNERACHCRQNVKQDADRSNVLSTGKNFKGDIGRSSGDRGAYSEYKNINHQGIQKVIARRSLNITENVNQMASPYPVKNSDMNVSVASNVDGIIDIDTDRYMINNTDSKKIVTPLIKPAVASVGAPNNNNGIFVRWGRRTCGLDGTLLIQGIAASLENSSPVFGGQSLDCIKTDAQVMTSFTASYAGPLMSEAKLNLLGSFPTSSWTMADMKKIPCSVCSWPSNNLIMLFGSNFCSSGWVAVYNGYVMSQWKDGRTNVASTPICVDSNPDITLLSTAEFSTNVNNPNAPEFSFVRSSGSAFPSTGRLIPCVLCAQ